VQLTNNPTISGVCLNGLVFHSYFRSSEVPEEELLETAAAAFLQAA